MPLVSVSSTLPEPALLLVTLTFAQADEDALPRLTGGADGREGAGRRGGLPGWAPRRGP